MDLVEMLNYYVRSELIIVIPVLYILEKVLAKTKLKSSRIPLVLLAVSLIITGCYTFSVCTIDTLKDFYSCMFSILTQSVLITGGSLFINTFRLCVGGNCKKGEEDQSNS